MKKIALAFSALLVMTAVHAQTSTSPILGEDISKVITFGELDHDFGKIPYGKPAEFQVVITNISADSVKLQDVKAGCGCTTPKWEAGPYAPGQTFNITIGFNGYTEGSFTKIVTVFLDGGLSQVLKFHGETYKNPDNPAPGNSGVQQLKDGGNQ